MKKLLLLLAILFCVVNLSADEFRKNNVTLAATFASQGIKEGRYYKSRKNELAIGLRGSVFLGDQFALEAEFSYLSTSNIESITQVGLGFRAYFVKEFFLKMTPQLVFMDGLSDELKDELSNSRGILYTVGIGYNIFINKHVYIEPSVHYNFHLAMVNEKRDRHHYYKSRKLDLAGFGFALSFGVKF